jgi:hypothetical protein
MKHMQLLAKVYLLTVVLVCLGYLGLKAPGVYYMLQAKQVIAAGGFPQQFGLVNAVVSPCSCSNPTCTSCTGNGLCSMALAPCTTYNDVMGTQAGGDGNDILMTVIATNMIGLSSGGQVIAGGTSNTMLQVSASKSGMYQGQ